MADHCKCALATHLIHACFFVIFAAFQCMALGGVPVIFQNGTLAMAETYDYDMQPSRWVFIVNWVLVIVLMAMYHGYRIYTLFSLTADGSKYLYMSAPSWTNSAGILIQQPAQLIAALFMWGNNQLWGGFAFYAVSCFFAVVLLATVLRALPVREATSRLDGFLRSFMVHNAVAALAMWTFLLTMITLGVCLTYELGVTSETAGIVVASLILVTELLLISLEITVLRTRLCHVTLHWTILLMTASGVIARLGFGTANWVLALVIIVVAILSYVLKVVVNCWYGKKGGNRNATGESATNVGNEKMKEMEGGPM